MCRSPPRPEWLESLFSLDGEYSDLTDAPFWFERYLGEVFFFRSADQAMTEAEAVKEQLAAQVAPLRTQQLYEGRQLVYRDIRSVDLTKERAVVVVRETWQDWLGEIVEDADYPWGEPMARRGPYNLDVTYTLERGEWGWWEVTDILYANSPPAW